MYLTSSIVWWWWGIRRAVCLIQIVVSTNHVGLWPHLSTPTSSRSVSGHTTLRVYLCENICRNSLREDRRSFRRSLESLRITPLCPITACNHVLPITYAYHSNSHISWLKLKLHDDSLLFLTMKIASLTSLTLATFNALSVARGIPSLDNNIDQVALGTGVQSTCK